MLRQAGWVLLGLLLTGASPAGVQPAPTIPFEFVNERRILFPVTVNGHPAEAWLDSGASATVVHAAFAKAAGVAEGVPVQGKGVNSAISGVRLTTISLGVGGAPAELRTAAVMDMTAVSRAVDRPIQVILGRDVFDSAVVDLDFAARRLRLIPRAVFMPPKAPPLPLKPLGNLRGVPIRIAGTDVQAVLDLGNAGAMIVDRDFAQTHGLLAGRRASTELGVGADGAHVNPIATLDPVRLAGITFHDVPATFPEHLTAGSANVGLAVIGRFHAILDFKGDRAWLLPGPDAAKAPFRKNRAGLAVQRAGAQLVVGNVAVGSPAAAAGWKVGDAIAAVDGVAIGPDYPSSAAFGFVWRPAGTQVALTMTDGSVRRLTLGDYY